MICAPFLPPVASALMRGPGRATLVNLAITVIAVVLYVAMAAGIGLLVWMLAALHALILALLPRPAALTGVRP